MCFTKGTYFSLMLLTVLIADFENEPVQEKKVAQVSVEVVEEEKLNQDMLQD